MSAPPLRAFLIGYEPPGWNFGLLADNKPLQRKLEKLMEQADLAAVGSSDGWPVGESRTLETGGRFVCVGHEYDGKIVLIEKWES